MSAEHIQIQINGKSQEIEANLSIQELLQQIKLSTPAVAVEVNLQLIPREQHASTRVQQGDQLEIVSLVGGG